MIQARYVSLVLSCAMLAGSMVCTSASDAAEKGPVPEGLYTLMKISGASLINLGEIEIRKSTYRDEEAGEFKEFKINDKGEISWSKPLAFLPDGWKHVRSEFAGKDEKGRPMLRIFYESARGTPDVIDGIKEQ
ncbi:hypothetical protein Psta_4685 [Pirellula staleyi DSM 6068]|uniref:Uncharacterized protein n=1 Tax=Pirellula staleyi (strain ATCC 27377 / DSM 6068 / ICPB 4128) TaxID=530564 RepID=D2R7Z6_PIRSD|nr:hypothetical protein Psta_4685 [Pirellula staleyi DSM 6068]